MKVAIVGAGKLGIKVAQSLVGGNADVTLIDKVDAKLEKYASQMDVLTITGNGKDLDLMREYDIGSYDFLIAVTDNDEKNLVIARMAKAEGCSKVIARVRDPEYMNNITSLREIFQVDYIVNPDLAIASEIYKYLVEQYTLTGGKFTYNKMSIVEFSVSKMAKLIGTRLTDFNTLVPDAFVVAIDRNGKVIIPDGDTVIGEEDVLYVVGEDTKISPLYKAVHEKNNYTDVQRVMIIGGGKTGLYLAKMLMDYGCSVKIIESDKERCFYLSEKLEDVLVLNGNGGDLTLLEEENLEEMDACVLATGFDEDNLMLALMAKKHGVNDVIAKISRENYSELIEQLGIDVVLNPQDMTSSNILSYIQGSKNILAPVMIQGQAEIRDLRVVEDMKFVGKAIKDIEIPEGTIIAAINRGFKLLIPNGDTVIQQDDHMLMLTLLSELPEFEKFISTD